MPSRRGFTHFLLLSFLLGQRLAWCAHQCFRNREETRLRNRTTTGGTPLPSGLHSHLHITYHISRRLMWHSAVHIRPRIDLLGYLTDVSTFFQTFSDKGSSYRSKTIRTRGAIFCVEKMSRCLVLSCPCRASFYKRRESHGTRHPLHVSHRRCSMKMHPTRG